VSDLIKKPKSLYWRQRHGPDDGPFCGECGEPVMLLATDFTYLPAFYVCISANCGWIGQIGVGPVPDLTDKEER